MTQLLKTNRLNKYVAPETDSSGIWVLLKYRKNLFIKNGLLHQRVTLKNHLEPITQFVLPKRFICNVILTCHDDNGHLGMERTLGLLQERFFWPKMAEDMHIHIHTCDRCLRFKQPQEKAEMQPNLVSYPLELIHLDFLTLGGKMEDTKNVNILNCTRSFYQVYAGLYYPKTNCNSSCSYSMGKHFSALWMAREDPY